MQYVVVCILCGGLVRIDLSVYAAVGRQHRQTDRYAPGTPPRTTHNFINQKSKLACNSEGTDELPEDGTQLPKHVGAAK
jgi:hypothetical protein